MSELMNTHENRTNFRRKLLTTVSALVLLASVYAAGEAKAADNDSDRPAVWIELGGQLSRLEDGQDTFSPSVMADRPAMFSPSQKFERPPLYGIDETGKISFEPDGAGWVFSASIRYGRSASKKEANQQTYSGPISVYAYYSGAPHRLYQHAPAAAKFANTNSTNSENHLIMDFQAGKDVGPGMFGGTDGSSTVNFGVRFAQFGSKSNIALKSEPGLAPIL